MADKTRITPQVIKQLLSYDPQTGKFVWLERGPEMLKFCRQHILDSFNTKHAGKPAITAINNRGYHVGSVMCLNVFAHRVAFVMMRGEWPSYQVDHINGIQTDNRWENLRQVDRWQNNHNTALSRRNTSGHMGVHWDRNVKKWYASVTAFGKRHGLGYHADIESAIAARKTAESKLGFHPNHGRHQTASTCRE